jgi:hypothetical protein
MGRFGRVITNWYGIMSRTKRLTFFTQSYAQAAVIFPYILVAPAYFAKTAAFVQRDAGGVFRKYPGLQCPDAVSFGFNDEGIQQRAPYSRAASRCRYVNTHFGDASVHAAARYRTERRPTHDIVAAASNESGKAQMRSVPPRPVRSFGLERRVSRSDAFKVNRSHELPIVGSQCVYHNRHRLKGT